MRALHIRDFDSRAVERNTKEALQLEVTSTPGGMPIRQTVLVIGGAEPGPVLLVSGGVHGDEYEGPLTITRLFHELQPADIKGTFVGLVVTNVPAFEAATRCSPIDGLNLARVFPGDVNGSVTMQIAHWMGEQLIGKADFYIDLHSSGSDMEMVQLAGYTLGDGPVAETRRRMAEAFRAQVTWAHTDQAAGRTLSYAMEHDIPAIYTECPASRRVSIPDVEVYQRGVRNVLRELGMLDGELEGEPSPYYFCGVGNTDTALPVSRSGYFIPAVELLEWVEANDLLGAVYDLAGNVLEEIRAPSAGYVGLRQLLPTINAGDTVFMLAERFEA